MPEAVIVDAVRPRSAGPSRARSPRCARTRWGHTSSTSSWSATPTCARADRGGPLRGRHAAGPPGLQHRPHRRPCCPRSSRSASAGSTISRYCASSLESIRGAANSVKAGQGDTYIAAGVEWVSRYNERSEAAGEADQNPNLQGNNGQPNAYIAMGLTAENVAEQVRGQPRGHGQVRAALTGARRRVAGVRLLRPRDRSGGAARREPRRQGRRPARQLDAGEALPAAAGVQGGRQGHGRQLVPAERRRGGGAGDVARTRPRSSGSAAGADHHRGTAASSRS